MVTDPLEKTSSYRSIRPAFSVFFGELPIGVRVLLDASARFDAITFVDALTPELCFANLRGEAVDAAEPCSCRSRDQALRWGDGSVSRVKSRFQ
jgi:hypothetical protein